MPMVDTHLILGVFSPKQKREMITKVTDTMVAIEGEALRDKTWVRIIEIASGEWGVGGHCLKAEDIKAIQGEPA